MDSSLSLVSLKPSVQKFTCVFSLLLILGVILDSWHIGLIHFSQDQSLFVFLTVLLCCQDVFIYGFILNSDLVTYFFFISFMLFVSNSLLFLSI